MLRTEQETGMLEKLLFFAPFWISTALFSADSELKMNFSHLMCKPFSVQIVDRPPSTPPHPPAQITSFQLSLHYWKPWECNLTKSQFTQRILQILHKNSSVEKDGCGWVGAAYCASLWGPGGPAGDFATMRGKFLMVNDLYKTRSELDLSKTMA